MSTMKQNKPSFVTGAVLFVIGLALCFFGEVGVLMGVAFIVVGAVIMSL